MENTLNYLNPQDVFFSISEGGLLELEYKGENIGRISVLRMFPFQYEDEYIVLRKESYSRYDKENEIGILRKLSALESGQAEIIKKELEKRYFIPAVTEVYDVKEEFGHTTWNVNTTAGKREFTVTDMGTNVRKLSKRIMLTDVYGNRYYITDINKLSDKALKVLEIWI